MKNNMSLKNIRIGKRLNIMLGSIVVLIISVVGMVALYSEYDSMEASMEFLSFEETNNLKHLIERDVENKQSFVASGIKVAHMLFYQKHIQINNSKTNRIKVVNQFTQKEIDVKLPEMLRGGSVMFKDTSFVDGISELLGGTATVFQKVSEGFVRVSTNVINNQNQRSVGSFIPNGSPVVNTVLKGETYKGRAFVVDDWCVTMYEPIVINGKVEGMIYVGVKEKDLPGLRQVFNAKQYLKSGYPCLVSKTGELIIHPTQEGLSVADQEFYKLIISSGENKGKFYYWFNGKRKQLYFEYVPSVDAFVAVTYYTDDLNEMLYDLFLTIAIALVLGITLFVLVNRYIASSISKPIRQSVQFAERVANGDLSAEILIDQKDEVGQMAIALNSMIHKLRYVMSEITRGSENIASAGHQVNYTSMQISKGANDQAASVEEVSSTMEEMVSNIELNSEHAKNTEKISSSAHLGMKEVYEKAYNALEATKGISDKIGVINDIAM